MTHKRLSQPYRSGINAHVPLTPEMLIVFALLRVMRAELELYYPREKTRQN